MRKASFLIAAPVLLGFLTLFSFCNDRKTAAENNITASRDPASPVAVVELFTSEGCSSCPPADALLGKLPGILQGLISGDSDHVFLLAFHVDYWNDLGWNDRFSDAAYSDRQRMYCRELESSVYTPQMIVNGSVQFTGSNKMAAISAIRNALQHPAANSLSAQGAWDKQKRQCDISYTIQGPLKDITLHAALLEDSASTDVARGENGGLTLHHTHVVRTFISTDASASGSLVIALPADLDPANTNIVLFTQDDHLRITGAAHTVIADH